MKVIDHPALDVTAEGITSVLRNELPNVKIIYESAQGDSSLAQQIVQKFLQQKIDAIVTVGTVVTQVAMQQTNKVPIVFASVTDPVNSGIIKDLNNPTGNITGVSNFSPDMIHKQLEFFKKLIPNLKRIAVIYNSGESNSIFLIEQIKDAAKQFDIVIKEGIAQNTNDAVFVAKSLLHNVDAIFVNNDNTALGAIKGIVDVAMKSYIPVFCSDIDTVKLGVLAAVGPDQYKLGENAGQIVVDIVKNKQNIHNTPVQYVKEYSYLMNTDSAKNLGIEVPNDPKIKIINNE